MTERMDVAVAVGWIAYAGRKNHDAVYELGLTADQYIELGEWLAASPIVSPYARPKAKAKRGVFKCLCGCGERFDATWTTRKPSYKNHAHRQRAYINQRKRSLADTGKEWLPNFED